MPRSQEERLQSTRFPRFGVVALAIAWAAVPVTAQSPLPVVTENLDGAVHDIAGQQANGADPTKRVWLAQGRARMAVQLSTRLWMNDESESFTKAKETYPGSAPTTNERIVAVEVNEGRLDGKDYLYTLTESALYRQDITADPSNPLPPVWIPLIDVCDVSDPECPIGAANHFDNGEEMMDFKVWNHPTNAESGKIFLLTDRRVVVLKDKTAAITYKSSADELLDNPGNYLEWTSNPVDSYFNSLKVKALLFLEIAGQGAT